MIRSGIFKNFSLRGISSLRNKSSAQLDIEKLEQDSLVVDVIEDETKQREEEIERKRNKSRLKEHDRNFLFEKRPYSEPKYAYQGTIKYYRRLYGRYGEASGVDPSICWPNKGELEETIEYEKVAYPFKIPEMIAEAKQKRIAKNESVRLRQEEIVKKMAKLEGWKQDLFNRIAKKENEAMAAKERKERLVEEVRRHFGYTVDPRDERFKEMLEKKEKEQKKAMKEARKKAREEKMVDKLLTKKAGKKSEGDDTSEKVKQEDKEQ